MLVTILLCFLRTLSNRSACVLGASCSVNTAGYLGVLLLDHVMSLLTQFQDTSRPPILPALWVTFQKQPRGVSCFCCPKVVSGIASLRVSDQSSWAGVQGHGIGALPSPQLSEPLPLCGSTSNRRGAGPLMEPLQAASVSSSAKWKQLIP